MSSDYRIFRSGFGAQAFEITCSNAEAFSIAEFLFQDFPGAHAAADTQQYGLVSSGSAPMLSLWQGDKRFYFGTSRYQLSYILMNEIIYHCINTNSSHHALHAGCVCRGDRCILLPGRSGSGKSLLTSWLVLNGFSYLTDELVFLDPEGRVHPLTRPINLKVGPEHVSWPLPDVHETVVTGDTGAMIPHRLLNPRCDPGRPAVTDIIFPRYAAEAEPEFLELSPARSSLYLLRSHVNARNLERHGVPEMASIVRRCRSFTLGYSSFEALPESFLQELGLSA